MNKSTTNIIKHNDLHEEHSFHTFYMNELHNTEFIQSLIGLKEFIGNESLPLEEEI